MSTHTDTTPIPVEVEHDLRAISTWSGGETRLWEHALSDARQRSTARSPSTWLSRRTAYLGVAAAGLLIACAFVATNVLGTGHAREFAGQVAMQSSSAPLEPFADRTFRLSAGLRDEESSRTYYAMAAPLSPPLASAPVSSTPARDEVDRKKADTLPADVARQVIRKAQLDLTVPDPRDAFAKAQHLLRVDLGEYVESSALTGQDTPETARAQLTLRVAATRLDDVLNQLRALGKVESENAGGDDVTAQAVDLDARLRNERQVECELLKLLDARSSAAGTPLKDVLELRDHLTGVRQSIERLQGQRDSLARQVSLATILVILHPSGEPKPAPKPASTFDTFSNEISSAWSSGLTILTQTIAFLLRVAVGGLIWWLLLLAAIAIARRVIRRLIPDPARVPI